MTVFRLFSVLAICCALTIAGCSKSSTEAGLEKEDLDGDGIGNIYDPDIDGDGIPNGSDPDIDGDGIPNDQDPDMDGDGKPNGKDPDPENNDPNYCDQIQVYGLNDEQTTGSEIVLTWNLQSSKTGGDCVLKEGVKADLIQVTASAVGVADTKSEETNPLARAATRIQIPLACTGETVEVTYDFTEIATLIKADPNAPGWTVPQTHRADPKACDTDGDGLPDFGPAVCSFTNDNIRTAVDDYIAGGGHGNYKDGSAYANCGLIGTWDVSGVTSMYDLFFNKSSFNEDISDWDVSKVRNMATMFWQASSFNQDIGSWNVSRVVLMVDMFRSARYFYQDLSGWCVKRIPDKPDGFDYFAGFTGQEAKQPQWGTCP